MEKCSISKTIAQSFFAVSLRQNLLWLRVQKSSGYSLIETLVTVLIGGIIITLSVPSLKEIQTLRLLRPEAHRLKHELEDLMLKAQSEKSDYELIVSSTAVVSQKKGVNQAALKYNFPKNVNALLSTPLTVSLYKSGVASPVTINLKAGQSTCKIKLSLRGRVEVAC